jgi:uncharacterized membrane protein
MVVIRGPDYFYSNGFDSTFWNHRPNGEAFVHHIVDKVFINNTWYFMTGIMNGRDKYSNYIDGMFFVLNKTQDYLLFEFNYSNVILLPPTEILGVVVGIVPLIGHLLDSIPYFLFHSITLILIIVYINQTSKSVRIITEKKRI